MASVAGADECVSGLLGGPGCQECDPHEHGQWPGRRLNHGLPPQDRLVEAVVERPLAGNLPVQQPEPVRHETFDGCCDQAVLVAEVVVQRGRADSCFAADLLNRQRGRVHLGQGVDGGTQNPLIGGGSLVGRWFLAQPGPSVVLNGCTFPCGCEAGSGPFTRAGSAGRYRARRMSAAFSATIYVAALVLPRGIVGNTDASTTRRPATPWTRRSASTTPVSSEPMRAVLVGW